MYGELIVGLNMLFNYAILSFANKIGSIEVHRRRLILAAFVGAVPVTLYPASVVAVIASFFGMTACAFGKNFDFWKKSSGMVLVGAVFAGGLLTALQAHIQSPDSQTIILLYALIAFVFLSYMKRKWLDVRTARHVSALTAKSTLHVWAAEIPLTVFIDSGNSCTEPLSGAPVHFISVRSVENFIPTELKDPLFSWNPSGPATLAEFPDAYLKDLRLVRLLTVQGRSWAVGIKYDRWIIEEGHALKQGYFVLTKEDRRYPDGAEAILHVSAMESINGERGAVHAT